MTDVTLGDAGGNERLAFIFNRTRVQPSGLAAEWVVPPDRLDQLEENALSEQFARTPYAVSFRRGDATFILVTLHILFGEASADRIPELQEIADIFRDWARRSNRWHHNLMYLLISTETVKPFLMPLPAPAWLCQMSLLICPARSLTIRTNPMMTVITIRLPGLPVGQVR